MTDNIAIIQLGPGAALLAAEIKAALPGAEIHSRQGVGAGDVAFTEVGTHLRALFAAGRPIIGICASAILIRCLAGALGDKTIEPPVIAVAEDGSAVVPLLGGHGGANELSQRLARALGSVAAITTASEVRFGISLDEAPEGYRLADRAFVKPFVAQLLAGAGCRLEGQADWLRQSGLPFADDGAVTIAVTDKSEQSGPHRLVYHPASLAVGVGCARGTEAGELIALVRDGLEQAGLSAQSVAGIFSIDVKADEPAVHALAEELGVAARFFTAEQLEKEKPRLASPSARVFAEVGCHGVAEGAALAAAGAEGDLILPKQKSANATCAIARAPAPIDARQCGHARGRLAIIGIGPGTDDWRTPEASALVARADCLVGYGLYLDLLGPLAEGKERHEFPLGAEEVRVRAALDLAAQGRDVALISSGDAGIYAMASLAFELLATGDAPGWARIAVRVAPGISALQAAAARAGAPLGHDFCAISLSDLLTPWDAIRKRIEAAAAADFVVAFYNPASQKRRHQLVEAMSILRAHRPGDTPVILARNLGRADERVRFTTIAACDPDEVDMLTLVMVGASSTRRISQGHSGEWVFTPRGYEGKNKR